VSGHDPRHLFAIEHGEGRVLRASGCDDQRFRRHDHSELRDQNPATFDATINPNTAAAGRLGLSNGGVEEFWNANAVQHFLMAHDFPQPHKVVKHQSTIFARHQRNRFRDAPCHVLAQLRPIDEQKPVVHRSASHG